jgi:hypothetical protein
MSLIKFPGNHRSLERVRPGLGFAERRQNRVVVIRDKAAVLAQWAKVIASSARVEPLPLRLCLACARLLGADGGAITLAYTRAERVTLCATDDTAARLEDLQDVLGQGPGQEAYRSGQAVAATLASAAPSRWPMFAEAARAAVGRAALYAYPIRPDGEVLGVLTLYQATPRPLHYEETEAQFLADALGVALLRDPCAQTETGAGPWAGRARVHQATGIVIAQLSIGPDDALALMRAHAYAHATSLDSIADQLIGRQLDFSSADSGTDIHGNETP